MQGFAAGDPKTKTVYAQIFVRIVGHEPDAGEAHIGQDLGSDPVLAVVYGQTQVQVGVHGVETLILQFVGPEFVADPDSSSLVTSKVNHHALAFFHDPTHRFAQLVSTIAFHASKDVTCKTFAVDPDKNVLGSRHVTVNKSKVCLSVDETAERNTSKLAKLGGEAGVRYTLHQLFSLAAITDQISN
jgi:hypothetical protein